MSPDSNPAFSLVDRTTSAAMGLASRLRHARFFHPTGVAFRTKVHIRPGEGDIAEHPPGPTDPLGVELLDKNGDYDGVVRFSRGGGLPESLPDVLGLAVRIENAHGEGRHQDLLLATSGPLPITRQLLIPTYGFGVSPFSSVLPYELGNAGRFFFGARPVMDKHGSLMRKLSDVTMRGEGGVLTIELVIARHFGPWRRIGIVDVCSDRLSDAEAEELKFNALENTGGGIQPAGWLQQLRRRAYSSSQAGRDAAE